MDASAVRKPETDWKLTSAQVAACKAVAALLAAKGVVQWERAGNEVQFGELKTTKGEIRVIDSSKDPYTGSHSSHPKSNSGISTDGKKKYTRHYSLPSGDMSEFEVSGYNYIVVHHHFPGAKGNDVKYQSVIVKEKNMRYYIKHLIKEAF